MECKRNLIRGHLTEGEMLLGTTLLRLDGTVHWLWERNGRTAAEYYGPRRVLSAKHSGGI